MLIALTGRMGSGKSSAIDVLKSVEGNVVALRKIAEPLYQIQEFIYRLVSPVYTRPDTFAKDRLLLQWLGTEWGRSTISPSLWVDLWRHNVEKVRSRDASVIIVCDDCRHDNEAEAVMAAGGYVIKIQRDNAETHAQGGIGIQQHSSEAGVSPELVDYVVTNNGTIEEFKESLLKVFNEIKAIESGNSAA